MVTRMQSTGESSSANHIRQLESDTVHNIGWKPIRRIDTPNTKLVVCRLGVIGYVDRTRDVEEGKRQTRPDFPLTFPGMPRMRL